MILSSILASHPYLVSEVLKEIDVCEEDEINVRLLLRC